MSDYDVTTNRRYGDSSVGAHAGRSDPHETQSYAKGTRYPQHSPNNYLGANDNFTGAHNSHSRGFGGMSGQFMRRSDSSQKYDQAPRGGTGATDDSMFNENQGAKGAQTQYQPGGGVNNGYAFQGLNFYNKYMASTSPSNPSATNYTQNSFSVLNNRDTENNSFMGTSVGGG